MSVPRVHSQQSSTMPYLIKVPEHTWGVDIKTTLRDEVSWSNAALASKLHLQELNYVATVHSWQRQHAYIQWALDALGMPCGVDGFAFVSLVLMNGRLCTASQPQHYASALAAVQAVGQNVEVCVACMMYQASHAHHALLQTITGSLGVVERSQRCSSCCR